MIPSLAPIRPSRARGLRYLGGAADISNSTTNPGSGNIFAGGLPDPVQAGDLIILALNKEAFAPPATPSGFTSLFTVSETAGNNDVRLRVCYRFMSGPWTGVTSGAEAWAIQAWRGVDQSTPFDVTSTTTSHSTITADPPSITPTTSGAFIVCVGMAAQTSSFSVSSWSGLSNLITDNGTGGSYYGGIGMASYEWTSGAYDPPAWTTSGTTDGSDTYAVSASIALRPAT